MASADAFTLSARVPHKTADEFKALADSIGLSPNALIKDMIERAVAGKPALPEIVTEADKAAGAAAGKAQVQEAQLHVPAMYGPALTLIDDLMDKGYPDSEIQNALTNVRREML